MTTATAYDSDAQAFFTAAGITDSTQKSAVNQLVLDLKSYSIWTKFIAIYPLVGGTATTHKYNLKNPVDTDAGFRIVFSGGITHDANGITGNGTTGYGDTKINANTHLSQNDVSAFVYVRTNSSGAYTDLGALKSSAPQYRVQMNSRNGSDLFNTALTVETLTGNSNTDSRGFFGISRIASTEYKQTKTSTQTKVSVSSTGKPNANIGLMALISNAPGVTTYSPRNLAFAAVGTGLTDTECDNLYTAVQAFQTTLSRNV